MGKGDRKTKRGKIAMGTYGVSRPRPSATSNEADTEKKKTRKKPAKKRPAKAKSEKK